MAQILGVETLSHQSPTSGAVSPTITFLGSARAEPFVRITAQAGAATEVRQRIQAALEVAG
eukprot:12418288-Prorocentrum_lima.AAC.1